MDTTKEQLQAEISEFVGGVQKLNVFLKDKELQAVRGCGTYPEFWQAVLSTVTELQEFIKTNFPSSR